MNSVIFQDTKSMYRNTLRFYTLIMKQQKEINKIIPFTNAPKVLRYLGINLTNKVGTVPIRPVL